MAVLTMAALAGCTTPTEPTGPTPAGPTTTPPMVVPPTALNGTAYYAAYADDAVQVLSASGGTVRKHGRIPFSDSDPCVVNSVVVSGDGRWLAWVVMEQGAPQGGIVGVLHISGLDAKNPITRKGVTCALVESDWSADGRLAISQSPGDAVLIDPKTGATTPNPDAEGDVWSANRAFRVKADPGAELAVQDARGATLNVVRDYTNDYPSFDTCGYTVHGVSDDGRYVTIASCATDPSRILPAHTLLDTETGRPVTLPFAHIDDVRFLGDGTVIVRGGDTESGGRSLALIRATGEVLEKQAEPAGVQGEFLTYAWNAG